MKKSMKYVVLVVGLLTASLLGSVARAENVSVSTNSVTTISSGNSSRKHLMLQNTSTVLKVYYSKYSSSATANAGNILNTAGSEGDVVQLLDYTGPVYAIAQSSAGPGAISAVDVRYFQSLK